MKFGEAFERLRNGEKITRRGWNGKGMYLHVSNPGGGSNYPNKVIYLKTVNDGNQVWDPSQFDLFSEDWERHVRRGD